MSAPPGELLQYLPEFKVVVCTTCQYALQPSAISRHLKDIHRILRSQRKPFMQYVERLDLDSPENVIRSTDNLKDFPVPLLPIQDGLKCNQEGCVHMCVTEKRMKSHWTLEHDRPGHPGGDWSPAPLQTFFRGNSLRYFTGHASSSVTARTEGAFIGDDEAALLHHYKTSTSLTLVDGYDIHGDGFTTSAPSDTFVPADLREKVSVWQEVFPQLAEDAPYLLHGLLACSARHLAYLRPVERQPYLLAAATHQELAMPLFREAVANIDSDNCHAIFAFAHLLVIYTFASEQENERLLLVDSDGPDVISHWLSFIRNGCSYAETIQHAVRRGPLESLLYKWSQPVDVYSGARGTLVERLMSVIPISGSEDAWSDSEIQVYRNAAYELGYAAVYAEELGRELNIWDVLRVWPVLVSNDYFQLLQALHPGALILLGHYCRLLHRFEGKWYLEGRAERLLGHVMQRLDPKWHVFVQSELR